KTIIKPMAENGQEPVGAMGNDTPHAVLSLQPQLLYSYFKQLFAQVTNPAIDPIREEIVMSLESLLGPEKNILEETPRHCHKLRVRHPVLTNQELAKLRDIKINGYKAKVISILFEAEDENDFLRTLERIYRDTEAAIKQGYTFIILSDRGVDRQHAALPALMAVSGLHHYLVKNTLRTQISIILESAEPREVHHFALLFGFGADAVNPYLVYEAVRYLIREKEIILFSEEDCLRNYIKAVEKGILKVLSKMGISTLQSYRGSQIFEALGLNKEVIESCFPGTVSRIGG
ncbi:MAG: glutamate synthase subunit alpha, partial [Candidatus Omnitrophica bacterium]|nr:glutamate synthase subunit alpha [Candidatus Omnitrophota bacterium]